MSTLEKACAEIEREAAYWETRRRGRLAHRLRMREMDDIMGELEELLLDDQRAVPAELWGRCRRVIKAVNPQVELPFTEPVPTLRLIDWLFDLQSNLLGDIELDPDLIAADRETEAEAAGLP